MIYALNFRSNLWRIIYQYLRLPGLEGEVFYPLILLLLSINYHCPPPVGDSFRELALRYCLKDYGPAICIF